MHACNSAIASNVITGISKSTIDAKLCSALEHHQHHHVYATDMSRASCRCNQRARSAAVAVLHAGSTLNGNPEHGTARFHSLPVYFIQDWTACMCFLAA
jgi:hypothetical protein